MAAVLFTNFKKFNPYHGADGRFTTGASATSFTYRTKDPRKQWMADKAKGKERGRVRKQAIHSAEDKIRNQDFESLSVIDANGTELLFKDGEKSQVLISAEDRPKLKGNTLTHNHPGGSCFSREDIGVMVGYDLQEIRATTRSGKTYSLSRNDGYTDELGMKFYNTFASRYAEAVQDANDALDAKGYQKKVRTGEISQEQANKECSEIVSEHIDNWLSKNADSYGLKFRIEERKAA